MKKPKILVVSTFNNPDKQVHAVDCWRSGRVIREIKKHTDWEITERPTIMKHIEKYKDKKDFTEEELQKTVEDLAQYDIVFGSYTSFMHAMVFALCKMVEDKFDTKFVIDVDDNMFAIKQDNIGWWAHMDHDKTWELQTLITKSNYIITTNEYLAEQLRQRQESGEVYINPNYISKDYKYTPDNHEELRIGYFGGASHLEDLHSTGMIPALRRIMHENKHIKFVTVGMPIEEYLPRKRYSYQGGTKGKAWATELWPTLNFDIALGPLTDDEFTSCKSDIKWQESAMMKAAFIGSNVRPYSATVRNGVDGLIVNNTEAEWYKAFSELLDDKKRKSIAEEAYKRVNKEFLVEDNWAVLKDILERIYNA